MKILGLSIIRERDRKKAAGALIRMQMEILEEGRLDPERSTEDIRMIIGCIDGASEYNNRVTDYYLGPKKDRVIHLDKKKKAAR